MHHTHSQDNFSLFLVFFRFCIVVAHIVPIKCFCAVCCKKDAHLFTYQGHQDRLMLRLNQGTHIAVGRSKFVFLWNLVFYGVLFCTKSQYSLALRKQSLTIIGSRLRESGSGPPKSILPIGVPGLPFAGKQRQIG